MFVDQVVVIRISAWKSDHSPAHHVLVPAVHGIGEEALHCHVQQVIEEDVGRYTVEIDPSLFQVGQVSVFLLVFQLMKRGSLRCEMIVDGRDGSTKQFGWRVFQLIALLRRALVKRSMTIEQLATSPRSRHLTIDVIHDACAERSAPTLVRGN